MYSCPLYTGNSPSRPDTEDNEMLQAADSVGVAMTELVNRAVNIKLPEIWEMMISLYTQKSVF